MTRLRRTDLIQMATAYDQTFFGHMDEAAGHGAARLIPIVIDLLAPKSIVDVGCGRGLWLKTCESAGVKDYLGIDGDYVVRDQLAIPHDRFVAADLTKPLTGVDRTFDLAICLEVAEHLPLTAADQIVKTLASLAPAVLFSAAIPFQPGTQHVNMQWQSWWAERFAHRGYQCFDYIRTKVWNDASVPTFYKQNALLYVSPDRLEALPALQTWAQAHADPILDVVHPEAYDLQADPRKMNVKDAARYFPSVLWRRAMAKFLKR